jgi:hypothetical protein
MSSDSNSSRNLAIHALMKVKLDQSNWSEWSPLLDAVLRVSPARSFRTTDLFSFLWRSLLFIKPQKELFQ